MEIMIIVGDFNTPVTSMDTSDRKSIMKLLNYTLDQVNLIDIKLSSKSSSIHNLLFGSKRTWKANGII